MPCWQDSERAGFVPEDRRHLGFFLWEQDSVLHVDDTPKRLFLESGAPLFVFSTGGIPPFDVALPFKLTKDTAIGPHKPPYEVPYEKFYNKEEQKKIIVLWLQEGYFNNKTPIQSITVGLIKYLERGGYSGKEYKFIGPFGSDILKSMTDEVRENVNVENNKCKIKNIKDATLENTKLWFYPYGASVPDKQLLAPSALKACGTLQDYFGALSIKLKRTIATDDALADGIVEELRRRGVKPGLPPDRSWLEKHLGLSNPQDDLALISEWDTFYGQTLPNTVEERFRSACKFKSGVNNQQCEPKWPSDDPWVHRLTYLRGLDGLLPTMDKETRSQDQNQSQTPTPGEKQAGTQDFFKLENETGTLERPIGQSQFDYLRRMSEELHAIDNDLRNKKNRKISAIGILGGDVFDKLLILRALKPEFPEAYFFTTDFDEAYTIKSELPYTRNLIISSGFGPNLAGWLQGDIPPFRDTYETSAFLATQLAIATQYNKDLFNNHSEGLFKNLKEYDYKSEAIPDQLRAARLFEVKRTGGILPFAWAPWHDDKSQPRPDLIASETSKFEGRSIAYEWPCWESNAEIHCGNIQPVNAEELKLKRTKSTYKPNKPKPIEMLFPTFLPNGGIYLSILFTVLAISALVMAFVDLGKNWRLELGFAAFCFIVGAAAFYYWEPFARRLTGGDEGSGEPIALMDGISLWPTVLLRLMSIVLAIYFVCRAKSRSE